MKKSLIALAALAATGAFAQSTATISGSFVAGYETQAVAAGTRTGGLGTDTAAIQVKATEDLGGGLKATAQVSLGGMMRDGAGTGEDAYLTLSGGFGTFALRTFESAGQGIDARARAGAPGYDMMGRVFSANANIDMVSYTSNAMSGFTFGVNYVDRGTVTGSGLNAGSSGPAAAQPSIGINAAYAAGPINALIDYTSWTRQGDVAVVANTTDNRVRLSGNYDFGAAKVGAGYSRLNRTTGISTTETELGFSAPLGAVTVGATWQRSATDAAAAKTGYTLGVDYALSKRTSVMTSYYNWTTDGVAGNNTGFRVLVGHSF